MKKFSILSVFFFLTAKYCARAFLTQSALLTADNAFIPSSFGISHQSPFPSTNNKCKGFLVVFASNTQRGDPLREATGIRPSLHPTTINALADALKARAKKQEGMVFGVSGTVKPLDVALTAGKIASTAIGKRQLPSEEDGMKLTPKEEQTIAGRVLGVIMRLDDLEQSLQEKVSNVGWIAKYKEWATFGTLPPGEMDELDGRIQNDPLFAVSRAECLLAIFLHTVEIPQMSKAKERVPDGSVIDFLDSDRMEVLLS